MFRESGISVDLQRIYIAKALDVDPRQVHIHIDAVTGNPVITAPVAGKIRWELWRDGESLPAVVERLRAADRPAAQFIKA